MAAQKKLQFCFIMRHSCKNDKQCGLQAYNEEKGLQATLNHLKQLSPAPHEIIVVDGGSSDRYACDWRGCLDPCPGCPLREQVYIDRRTLPNIHPTCIWQQSRVLQREQTDGG